MDVKWYMIMESATFNLVTCTERGGEGEREREERENKKG